MLPVLIVVLLLLSAVGILGLSRVPRIRSYSRYVALLVVGIATVLVLALRWISPLTLVPSLWQPTLLLGSTLMLQHVVALHPLAFVLALATLSALLVEVWRTEETPSGLVAALLASLAVSFISLWAANPLTMIIAWASYDLLQAASYVAVGISGRMAMRRLIFGAIATLLLWGGSFLPGGEGGSGLWDLMAAGDRQLALWAAAGVLRLWLYPFHLSASDDIRFTPALSPLFLGPVIGWGFWLRLILVNGGTVPGGPWVSTLAAITFAVGCFMAWSCRSPRSTLQWVGTGVTGAVLLVAELAKTEAVSVVTIGSVMWSLGLLLLFVHDGLQKEAPWWGIPALIGALALLGIPCTMGFIYPAFLLGEIAKTASLMRGGMFFFANLWLVPALARWLLSPPAAELPNRRGWLVARGVGAGMPALLLLLAGLYPPLSIGKMDFLPLGALFAAPGLTGWLLWVVSLVGGGVLAWQDRNVRPILALVFNALYDLLRLDWFYDVLVGALRRGLSVIRAADEVVGGAGALLWSLLLFLLIVLFWGGSR